MASPPKFSLKKRTDLFACLSICLFVYLSDGMFVCLPVCSSVNCRTSAQDKTRQELYSYHPQKKDMKKKKNDSTTYERYKPPTK